MLFGPQAGKVREKTARAPSSVLHSSNSASTIFCPAQLVERVFDRYQEGVPLIRPDTGKSSPDQQVRQVVDEHGSPAGLTVIYVRMTSRTWLADEAEVDRAIDGAVDRVMTRPQGSDNAVTATDASGGYMST